LLYSNILDEYKFKVDICFLSLNYIVKSENSQFSNQIKFKKKPINSQFKNLTNKDNYRINQKENKTKRNGSWEPKNENEEINLPIEFDSKSSNKLIYSINSFFSSEKKPDENEELNLSSNLLESNKIKHLDEIKSENGKNKSSSGKTNSNKKGESSIENENDASHSNAMTVKLNNTGSNDNYCYKIDNYHKILKEI